MRHAFLLLASVLAAAAPIEAAEYDIEILLHENPLHIAPATLAYVQGDTINVVVRNVETNAGVHDLKIEEYDAATPRLAPGLGSALAVSLDRAGTFEYYCTVPGHRDGGMRGFLTVETAVGDRGGGPSDGGNVVPWTGVGAIVAGLLLLAGARRR